MSSGSEPFYADFNTSAREYLFISMTVTKRIRKRLEYCRVFRAMMDRFSNKFDTLPHRNIAAIDDDRSQFIPISALLLIGSEFFDAVETIGVVFQFRTRLLMGS